MVTMTCVAMLKVVHESKIRNLLPNDTSAKRFEASGVFVKGSDYFVVFDNHTELARIANDFGSKNSNALIGTAPLKTGYEGIAYNAEKHRYYMLVESHRHDDD